jgi:hypothetical protein
MRWLLRSGAALLVALGGWPGPGSPAQAQTITTVAGAGAISVPTGIFVDGAGNLFITVSGSHSVRKVDPAGTISTVAGTGTGGFPGDGGPAVQAQLNRPAGVFGDGGGESVHRRPAQQ